jgi:hypothetical protein
VVQPAQEAGPGGRAERPAGGSPGQPGVDQRPQDRDTEDLTDLAQPVVHGRDHACPRGIDRRHGHRGHRREAHADAGPQKGEVPPDRADAGIRPEPQQAKGSRHGEEQPADHGPAGAEAADETAGLRGGHRERGPDRGDVKPGGDGRTPLDLLEVGAEVDDRAHEGEEHHERGDVRGADLRARHLDVAFVGLAASAPPGIDTHVVADEPLVAAVSADDTLAARTRIDLGALAGRALICLPRGTGLRALTDRAYAAEGIEPRIGFEASDPHILAELAGRGLGAAILPESVAAAHAGEVRAIIIDRPRLRARIALAWRTDVPMSPAARAFVEHVRATVSPRRDNAM